MTNLLRANFYRLRKTLIFWGALVVSAGFGVFMVYTRVSDHNKYGDVFILDDIFFVYAFSIGVILSVAVSTILGTEYSESTIRNKLAIGHLRRDVYLANLISMTFASWLYCAAYMLAVTVCGVPFAGWLTLNGKVIAITLLGSLVLAMAYSALYTFFSMNCNHKATTVTICIMLFFAMMVASTYVYNMLEAPPERTAYELGINGEFELVVEPNPRYLEGTKRTVYEFLFDLLPTGQATQYYMITFAHPLRMILCALGITAASTAGGIALFKQKNLK